MHFPVNFAWKNFFFVKSTTGCWFSSSIPAELLQPICCFPQFHQCPPLGPVPVSVVLAQYTAVRLWMGCKWAASRQQSTRQQSHRHNGPQTNASWDWLKMNRNFEFSIKNSAFPCYSRSDKDIGRNCSPRINGNCNQLTSRTFVGTPTPRFGSTFSGPNLKFQTNRVSRNWPKLDMNFLKCSTGISSVSMIEPKLTGTICR